MLSLPEDLHALVDSTNVHESLGISGKRPHHGTHGNPKKRVKLDAEESDDESEYTSEGDDSDVDMEDMQIPKIRARKRTVFGMRNSTMMSPWSLSSRHSCLPKNRILQSFVSSHKADTFKCYSLTPDKFMSTPFACSFSHDAKRGGTSLLAVATEQGAVHILNTSKRQDWDFEPQRAVFQPHTNGIFDVQWSPSDKLLATVSGDQTTRISSFSSRSANSVLYTLNGHSGTVKCAQWDPTHDGDILCTGGRDGSICLWDLRAGEGRHSSNGEADSLVPVITISGAHEDEPGKSPKPKGRKKGIMAAAPLRSVTGLIYPEADGHTIFSSGSFNGILRQWDLRVPRVSKRTTRTPRKLTRPIPLHASPRDPTISDGTRRARGITSLTAGSGPSTSLLFALGTDSRIHTYAQTTLEALPGSLTHAEMHTGSFYVQLRASPCGQWLASGGADGRAFLFDVSGPPSSRGEAVQLKGQTGEVGALDWAEGTLATCADDGTVRIWRPDIDVYRQCLGESEEMKWQWSWSVSG